MKIVIDMPEQRWIVGRNSTQEEFEKNYRRDHWAAEFIAMIEGATRLTTLYYTPLYESWFDEWRIYYKVVAWQPLPEPYGGITI